MTFIGGCVMSRLSSDSANRTKKPLLGRLIVDNRFCWISCLCTIGVMMLVLFCFDAIPFGDYTILRMDLYHQYGPLFAELYDRVAGLKSLLYSWQTGLGSPFIGNFFNYLSSPTAIIMLLFGHENMPEAIAGMIIAKAALASAAFCYYIKKSQGHHNLTTAAFGMLYAMCGYFVAYYWNVMWIDAMVFFPMMILGIEYIIRGKKPWLYIAALSLTLCTSYYMGYMACIFAVLYFFVYYFSVYDISEFDENTPYKYNHLSQKQYSFKDKLLHSRFLRGGLKFGFASLAAGCLVAVSLIPVYFLLKNCSATSGTMPDEWKTYFTIYDFLSNHIAAVEPTIRSSGEEVLPNVYCGIATLMLVPMYLYTKSIPLKEKIAYMGLLVVLFFSFNLNKLNYIWHGFHFPNDLPYRFSFMYSFILLILAYKAFTHLREFKGKEILSIGLSIVAAIVIFQEFGAKNVEDLSVIISIAFVATYCLVFVIFKNESYQRTAVSLLLLCCVIGEISCANTGRYSLGQRKPDFTGDYAEFVELKEQLDKHHGDDTYRMELTYNRARMDPAWFGYNGISTFTSMAYEKLSNLQSNLGMYGNYINSYTYHLQTPVYNMMHSLQYVVDNSSDINVSEDYYTKLMTSGKFTAYENKYNLPMAFGVDRQLADWFTESTNPFTVQSDFVELSTGVSDVFSRMEIDEIRYYNVDEIVNGLTTGDLYYTKSISGSDGEITIYLSSPETQHCYLFVDSSAFESIQIHKNGKTSTQETDEPYIYDLGVCSPEDEISVLMAIDETHDYGYIDFFPYAVNDKSFLGAYDILSQSAMNIESFDDTKLSGTVTVGKNMMLYTSIPFDYGWNVKIDGKSVAKTELINIGGGFLGVNLDEGTHTVEFKFVPQGLMLGLLISEVTALLIVLWVLIYKRLDIMREMRTVVRQSEAALRAAASDSGAEIVDNMFSGSGDGDFSEISFEPEE